MATESQVIAAVLAAINAAYSTPRAYEPSKVPTTRPNEFVTVTIAERPGGSVRAGRRSTRGWQVYVLAASSVSEFNARDSLEKAHGALVNRVLAIGSERSTPLALGPGRTVGPDSGWSTGTKSYTFTI